MSRQTEIDQIEREISEGSTTIHCGSGSEPRPINRWLRRAANATLAVALAMQGFAAYGEYRQTHPNPFMSAAQGLGLTGLTDAHYHNGAATGTDGFTKAEVEKAEVAYSFLTRLNQTLDQPVSLEIGLMNDDGEITKRINLTSDAAPVSCTMGVAEGNTFWSDLSKRDVKWDDDYNTARAEFQYAVAQGVYSCLQTAGLTETKVHPIAKYDFAVQSLSDVAGTAMVYHYGSGELDGIRALRDRKASNPDNAPEASREAAALNTVLKLYDSGKMVKIDTYADLGEVASHIGVVSVGFKDLGKGLYSAPDGTEISVDPASPKFGWQIEKDTDSQYVTPKYHDPVMEKAADEAERAAEHAATEGQPGMSYAVETSEDLPPDVDEELDPGLKRSVEFDLDGVLYKGHDDHGRACKEKVTFEKDELGDVPVVSAVCKIEKGKWEVIPVEALIRDGILKTYKPLPHDWTSPDGKFKSAEVTGNGMIKLSGDVGHDAAYVLIAKNGTNVFRDDKGHTLAVIGGPQNLNLSFADKPEETRQFKS
jgi:hypothetical protein